MEISEITSSEFAATYPSRCVFNSVAFVELNKNKADTVSYLSVHDAKPRFGIIIGERDGVLRSPFSAPFGGFVSHGRQRIEYKDEAVALLADYAHDKEKHLVVTPPALVYDITEMSEWTNVFSRRMQTHHVDLNYHFMPSKMTNYTAHIERNARKNLNHALKQDFRFVHLNSSSHADVARCYAVIRRNREERGFPLRMTLEQVWQTVSKVVTADFFVLEHKGCDVAAAQVFHVSNDVAQVVYWGDIREYSALRPMNMLTYKVFQYYHDQGTYIIDIGQSTEDGVPNFGLCEFKQSIGCDVTLKYSFGI